MWYEVLVRQTSNGWDAMLTTLRVRANSHAEAWLDAQKFMPGCAVLWTRLKS